MGSPDCGGMGNIITKGRYHNREGTLSVFLKVGLLNRWTQSVQIWLEFMGSRNNWRMMILQIFWPYRGQPATESDQVTRAVLVGEVLHGCTKAHPSLGTLLQSGYLSNLHISSSINPRHHSFLLCFMSA